MGEEGEFLWVLREWGGVSWGSGWWGKVGEKGTRDLLDAFVFLLLGFEALAGGDGRLEVWMGEISDWLGGVQKYEVGRM